MYRRTLTRVAAALLLALMAGTAAAADHSLISMEWKPVPRGDALVLGFANSPAPMPEEIYDGKAMTVRFVFESAAVAVPVAMRSAPAPVASIADVRLSPRPGGGAEVVLSLTQALDYTIARNGREVRVVAVRESAKGDSSPTAGRSGLVSSSPDTGLWKDLDSLVTVERTPRLLAQAADDDMAMDEGDGLMMSEEPMEDDLLGGMASVPATEQKAFLPPVGDAEEKYEEIFGASALRTGISEEIARRRIEALSFRDTPLQDALRLIATRGDLNILFNSEERKIKGTLTAELKNVALGDALESILRVYGLAAVQEGDIIQVVDREQVIEEKVELDVRVRPLNWVRAENLAETLEDFKSTASGAEIQADPESNALLIKDTQKSIVKLIQLVDKLDIPEKQVMIEMRLVDYNLEMGRDLQVDWSLARPDAHSVQQVGGPQSDSESTLSSAGDNFGRNTQERLFGAALANAAIDTPLGAPAFPSTLTPRTLSGQFGGLDVDAAGVSNGLFQWEYGTEVSILGNRFNLETSLQMLEARGIVSVLANPRVITLNNIPARIEVIRREPFFEATESQAGNISFQVQYDDVGIILNVTPNITNNNYVRMELAPEQKIFRGEEVFGNATANLIDTRRALVNVIVHDEDMIVLGGLRSLERTDRENAVPWLGRVPVIGWLFKDSARDLNKTELMLFVKPKIVKDPTLTEKEQSRYDEIDMSWILPDYFFDDARVVPDDFFDQF